MIRLFPISVLVTPENIETVTSLVRYLREELRKVHTIKIKVGQVTFTFKFRLWIGDHSSLQKSLGNKVGGTYRCELCDLDFEDYKHFWVYSHLLAHPAKTLKQILESWLNGKGEKKVWKGLLPF